MEMWKSRILSLLLVTIILLSGCTALLNEGTVTVEDENGTYVFDKSLSNETRNITMRAVGRLSDITGKEFVEKIRIDVISRERFKEESGGFGPDEDEQAFMSLKLKALHIIPEEENANETIQDFFGSNVLGYYSPSAERIVIITNGDGSGISEETLVHELVHALQDQHYSDAFEVNHSSSDSEFGANGAIEGMAVYATQIYLERCSSGQYRCEPQTQPYTGGRSGDEFVSGISSLHLMYYLPYSEGGGFIEEEIKDGNWEEAWSTLDKLPESSEQIIHPSKYLEDPPKDLKTKKVGGKWSVMDRDVVGESTAFVALWNAGAVDREAVIGNLSNSVLYDDWSYESEATSGWEGDSFVGYRNKETGGKGYVWTTEWESGEDAKEFVEAMTRFYDSVGQKEGDLWRKAGRYVKVKKSGSKVIVVGAPSKDGVSELG